jgi:hypothetical protein
VLPALMLLVIHQFKIDLFQKKSSTNIYFFIFNFIAFVSALSFIFSGYSIFSIVTLVIFLLISYLGLLQLFIGIKSNNNFPLSTFTIRAGIVFYFVSSISTWILPVLILTGLKKTPFYYYNIYFYLHFLFNGFITFMILALFLYQTRKENAKLKSNINKNLIIVFASGTILTFSGSLLWNKVPLVFNYLNFAGAVMMLILLIYFTGLVRLYQCRSGFTEKALFNVAYISLLIKVLMQTIQSFPYFAEASYMLKSQLIVGYMHLVTLGFISSFLISYAFRIGLIKNNNINSFFAYSFILSVVLTELSLFLHGSLMLSGIYLLSPYINILMFIFSIPLVLSIAFLLTGLLRTKTKLL